MTTLRDVWVQADDLDAKGGVVILRCLTILGLNTISSQGQRIYTRSRAVLISWTPFADGARLCPAAPTQAVHEHGHPDAPRLGPLAGGEHALDRARLKRRRARRDLRLLLPAARARPVRHRAPAPRARQRPHRVRRHPVGLGRRARRRGGARAAPGRAGQPDRAEGGRAEVRGAAFPRRAVRVEVRESGEGELES